MRSTSWRSDFFFFFKKMALMTLSSSSPTTTTIISLPKPLSSSSSSSSSLLYIQHSSPKRRKCQSFKIKAKLGGGEEDITKKEKKFITREQEPEQYWQSAGERAGENPMKTPLPYIIIFGMSTPFVILAIGFVQGWIKVPIR